MTMPSRSRWRGWAAAMLLLLAAAGGYALLDAGRGETGREAPDSDRDTVVTRAVPQPDPVMDRAGLLEAAALAASAFAAGDAMDDIGQSLAGRRFRLEMPLGCTGPTAEEAPLENGWRLDDDGRTLRAAFARQTWTMALTLPLRDGQPASPEEKTAPGDDANPPPQGMTVSGFPISRPWMRTAACPAGALAAVTGTGTPAAPAGGETLAIAEPADPDARAAGARRSGYRMDVRITPDQVPAAGAGLRVRIDGRLAASASPPVICRSNGPDNPPSCFLIARFETIAITSASGDRVHAEWRD